MDKSLIEHSSLRQPGDQIHSLRVVGVGHVDLLSVADDPLLQGIQTLLLPQSDLQHRPAQLRGQPGRWSVLGL